MPQKGDWLPQWTEFFVASDMPAIVKHTMCVLYLEDDNGALIATGKLHIHPPQLKEDRQQTTSQDTPIPSNELLETKITEIMRAKPSLLTPHTHVSTLAPLMSSPPQQLAQRGAFFLVQYIEHKLNIYYSWKAVVYTHL